jgi:hypothetical protein
MGVSPGMTVGIGATEEEADGRTKEAVDLSISGLTIMFDSFSGSLDEEGRQTEVAQDEKIER